MNSKTFKPYIPLQLSKLVKEAGKFPVAKRPRMSRPLRRALQASIIAKIPAVEPTKAELRYIKEGQEEFERGDFTTLKDWRNELADNSNKQGKKASW